MKKPKIYGEQFKLILPLTNVVCWNYTNGVTGSFSAGETITVLHAYDATHTTILCDGKPLESKSGQTTGYRFIVPNEALGKAIGVKMAKRTVDIIGDIMNFESGNGTQKQARRIARALKGTVLGGKFKGRYVS